MDSNNKSKLFRPPYGQIKKGTRSNYNGDGIYKIIMWSVLTQDWKSNISNEYCYYKNNQKYQQREYCCIPR